MKAYPLQDLKDIMVVKYEFDLALSACERGDASGIIVNIVTEASEIAAYGLPDAEIESI